MARFMITSPHTKEECVRALEETLAEGEDVLEKFEFGCKSGDHTAYGVFEAANENSARRFVPGFLRPKARFVEVVRFSPEQIRAIHAK